MIWEDQGGLRMTVMIGDNGERSLAIVDDQEWLGTTRDDLRPLGIIETIGDD